MRVDALPGRVLVSEMTIGERKVGSIYIPDDNGKASGVRARWAQVYSVGTGVNDIKVGEWILIQHGRWTRGVTIAADDAEITLWQVEYPAGVLVVSDEPAFETFANDVIKSEKLNRTHEQ